MARSNEFTHGGSNSKNLGLLLRALANIIAFALMWFGLLFWIGGCTLISLPAAIPVVLTIVGAALTVLLLIANLFGPFAHRVK